MKIVQETTDTWSIPCPNHVYVLDDATGDAVAYVPQGTKQVIKFSRPMPIDWQGRTFKVLKTRVGEKTRVIEGSKGDKYYITEEHGVKRCSCPGFKFRAKCRHLEMLEVA